MKFIENTLVLIKPDGVKRGLTGEIMSRFERAGLRNH
jgi:nucleoside-diphosphate kinase